MPQDNPRQERDNPRSESQRGERVRAEAAATAAHAAAAANEASAQLGRIGTNNVEAGLRMQKEMLDTFQEIGREWLTRATADAELAFSLPNKLTAARSIPDAFSAYQEWLEEWMSRVDGDSRHFMAQGRKLMDTGMRCWGSAAPMATT